MELTIGKVDLNYSDSSIKFHMNCFVHAENKSFSASVFIEYSTYTQ